MQQVLKRASHVMHAKVKSPDGKTLGQIDDLVLTPDLHSISYVAVSSGDMLGMGGTLHAVPWESLSQGVNDSLLDSGHRGAAQAKQGLQSQVLAEHRGNRLDAAGPGTHLSGTVDCQ